MSSGLIYSAGKNDIGTGWNSTTKINTNTKSNISSSSTRKNKIKSPSRLSLSPSKQQQPQQQQGELPQPLSIQTIQPLQRSLQKELDDAIYEINSITSQQEVAKTNEIITNDELELLYNKLSTITSERDERGIKLNEGFQQILLGCFLTHGDPKGRAHVHACCEAAFFSGKCFLKNEDEDRRSQLVLRAQNFLDQLYAEEMEKRLKTPLHSILLLCC